MKRFPVVAGILALTACGTRLPNSAFQHSSLVTSSGGPAAAAATQAAGETSSTTTTQTSSDQAAAGQNLGAGTPDGSGQTKNPTTLACGAGCNMAVKPGSKAGPGAKATAPGHGTSKANYASDRGVTASTITVGNIVSAGGIFGVEQFAKQQYGVRAFFDDLNTRGGINGRKVIVNSYNDNGDGDENVKIVNQAVNGDNIFAFVGNDVFNYAGSQHAQDADVPDIAGEGVDGSAYNKWSHFYAYGGNSYPRDNVHTANPDGYDYNGAQLGKWLKDKRGIKVAGIVYYDQPDSLRGAQDSQRTYSNAGIDTHLYPVNLGLPNFSNTVAQMQADNVELVSDALDLNGNQKLCQAIESNGPFLDSMQMKLTTEANWVQDMVTQFKNTPGCRQKTYANSSTWNYSDVANPKIAAFRAAMKKYFPSREGINAQWSLVGWVAGQWFVDAAKTCGADLTRACLEHNMVALVKYTAGGLLTESSFTVVQESTQAAPGATTQDCLSIAHWDDASASWLTDAQIDRDCITTPYFRYRPNG